MGFFDWIIKIIDWMNCNQGFVMGILTCVYVIATILIYSSNKKSTKAATDQIAEMKAIQLQNANIQLFEKRYEVYSLLEKWHNIAKSTRSSDVTPRTNQFPNAKEIFDLLVYRDPNNIELKNMNYQIEYLSDLLKNDQIQNESAIKEQIAKLNRNIHFVVIQSTTNDHKKINSAKYFYSTNSEKIKEFTDAFSDMAIYMSAEKLQKLESTYSELNQAKVLEQMEKQLSL